MDNCHQTIYLLGLTAACLIRLAHKVQVGRNQPVKRMMPWVEWPLLFFAAMGMLGIPISYLTASWLDFADYHPGTVVARLTAVGGAAVFALALWLLWRSHADLGRNFSIAVQIVDQHTLVTEGVYRSLRHPMYAAHWLWAIAQALLLPNWIVGPAMIIGFLPLYFARVPREEQLMLDHFGGAYRQYMDRTGRVLPRRAP